jgi:Dolichyl-phosphate-mannose-protein mannosyltransferase
MEATGQPTTVSASLLSRFGLAAMVVLTLASRLPRMGHPAADFDEQLYSLIGQNMLTGAIPYVDLWDRKPPGLFALYALFHAIGGASPLAYQIAAIAACLLGGWLTWRLGRRIADPGTAALGAALYPLLMALYGSHSGQSEGFFVPLLLSMAELLLIAKSRTNLWIAAAAMLCGGLALQIKYTALPTCLLFGALALFDLHRSGTKLPRLAGLAALFALLGLLPTLLVALWLYQHGAWDEFVFANFVSIGLRQPMPLHFTIGKQLSYAAPLAALIAGGALIAWRKGLAGPGYRLAAAWLAAGLAGLFMGSTIYVYYYAALVPVAILLALPLFGPDSRHGRLLALGTMVWLLIVLGPLTQYRNARIEREQLAEISQAIRPFVSDARHPLFIYDGPVVLYQLSGSALPSRFVYADHLDNQLESAALPINPTAEVARILTEKPGAIITSSQPVTLRNPSTNALIETAVAGNYRLLRRINFQNRPIEVYIRKD